LLTIHGVGKDLLRSGTWFGVTRTGRFILLTNYRAPVLTNAHSWDTLSRGKILTDFLRYKGSPSQFAQNLKEQSNSYDGYNVVLGTPDDVWYFSNKDPEAVPKQLHKGKVYGVSNRLLDTPWPKVVLGKQLLGNLQKPDEESLFKILTNTEQPPNEQLPDTGIGIETERKLSSIFVNKQVISDAEYGTRCSTVLTIDYSNNVTFIERDLDTKTGKWQRLLYQFTIHNNT